MGSKPIEWVYNLPTKRNMKHQLEKELVPFVVIVIHPWIYLSSLPPKLKWNTKINHGSTRKIIC